MSNEVMACPLCGDSGFVKVATRCKPEGEWEARMKCEECGIELIKSGETEDAAITALLKAWNTRAERTCRLHDADYYSPGAVMCDCGAYWFPENAKSSFVFCPNCGAKVVNNGHEARSHRSHWGERR